jgi:hypothetical protein
MALAERLKTANEHYQKTFVCKLMQVTLDPKLSESDVEAVLTIINSRPGDEAHVPNIRLAFALREEGYDVSPSAVDRHRRRICACYRLVKGE